MTKIDYTQPAVDATMSTIPSARLVGKGLPDLPAMTMVEKILYRKIGRRPQVGEYISAPVDAVMASDTTAPQMIRAFAAMGGAKVWDRERLFLVLDHAAPAPTAAIARLHQMVRAFAAEHGVRLYETGEGICHHLMLDNGHVRAGDLFMGADSHTCTYGAIGALACGVGSTDLAGVLLTGRIWLKVPPSLRIVLNGVPADGVVTKDIMLKIGADLGPRRCTYKVLEFGGSMISDIGLAAKIPFANMAAELGAKTAILETNIDTALRPDANASYLEVLTYDVSKVTPQVARPHSPHAVTDADDLGDIPITYAFLGSCTNTRIEDLRQAAAVVKGRKVLPSVRFYVVPATRQTLLDAISDGTMATLTAAGATFLPSGCGPCVGTHLGVPGDGENVISAANRNFQGRMGNAQANIYLASPATVAASALTGKITNPQRLMGG